MKTPMPAGVLAKIQKTKCMACGHLMPYPGPDACDKCAGTVLSLVEVDERPPPAIPEPKNPFYPRGWR